MIPIILAIIVILGCVFMGIQLLHAPYYDEKTNRYYRFVKDSDNPHHADCPRCGKSCRLIIRIGWLTPMGFYCPTDGVIWFDLEGGKNEM